MSEEVPADWNKMTVLQLKAALETRGLPSVGRKQDLIMKLIEHDAEILNEEDDAEDAVLADEEGDDVEEAEADEVEETGTEPGAIVDEEEQEEDEEAEYVQIDEANCDDDDENNDEEDEKEVTEIETSTDALTAEEIGESKDEIVEPVVTEPDEEEEEETGDVLVVTDVTEEEESTTTGVVKKVATPETAKLQRPKVVKRKRSTLSTGSNGAAAKKQATGLKVVSEEKIKVPADSKLEVMKTSKHRKVTVYPIKMETCNDPCIQEAIKKCRMARICYRPNKDGEFVGWINLLYRYMEDANAASEKITSALPDVKVHQHTHAKPITDDMLCLADDVDDSKKPVSSRDKFAVENMLFVGNLPAETTESELEQLFAGSSAVSIIIDGEFKSKGYAYVDYADSMQAKVAFAECICSEPVLHNHKLVVLYYADHHQQDRTAKRIGTAKVRRDLEEAIDLRLSLNRKLSATKPTDGPEAAALKKELGEVSRRIRDLTEDRKKFNENRSSFQRGQHQRQPSGGGPRGGPRGGQRGGPPARRSQGQSPRGQGPSPRGQGPSPRGQGQPRQGRIQPSPRGGGARRPQQHERRDSWPQGGGGRSGASPRVVRDQNNQLWSVPAHGMPGQQRQRQRSSNKRSQGGANINSNDNRGFSWDY